MNIVYMHGRSENCYSCLQMLEEVLEHLKDLSGNTMSINITVFDYPSYGDSTAATPRTEEEVNHFARAACRRVGFPPRAFSNQINIVWGYSAGTGPATRVAADMCAERDPGFNMHALLLQAPFDSIFSCSSRGKPIIGAAMHVFNKAGMDVFESGALMKTIKDKSEILVVVKHAELDELVPLKENTPRFHEYASWHEIVPGAQHDWFQTPEGVLDTAGTLWEVIRLLREEDGDLSGDR